MARRYSRVWLSLTDDAEYRQLTYLQQHTYELILRQRDLSACGVLSFNASRLALQAADLTPELVIDALATLIQHRFVVFDATTGEVAVRTFLRYDGVLDAPNSLRAAAKAWPVIHSPAIRDVVVEQLPTPVRDLWPDGLRDKSAPEIKALIRSPELPFPDHPQPPDEMTRTHIPHPGLPPVDNSLRSVDTSVEREREVLVAVAQHRIAMARERGQIIHSLPAYTARVVDNTRIELCEVIRRAVVNNPTLGVHELAALIDHEPPHAPIAVPHPLEWP